MSEIPSTQTDGPEGSLTWSDVEALMSELKGMARGLLAKEANPGGVKTTSLVLSALRRQKPHGKEWAEATWENRRYFFAAAYRAMRRALVDCSRTAVHRHERPAGNLASEFMVPLLQAGALSAEDLAARAVTSPERAEALDAAFQQLYELYPEQRLGEILEHHCFGGLTQKEVAQMLGVTERTIRYRLTLAKGLLAEALKEEWPELKKLV